MQVKSYNKQLICGVVGECGIEFKLCRDRTRPGPGAAWLGAIDRPQKNVSRVYHPQARLIPPEHNYDGSVYLPTGKTAETVAV
jgi:hypothetical protein